jgi:hypothetical protein
LNLDPPDLCLLSSQDYRCEPRAHWLYSSVKPGSLLPLLSV